MNDLSMFWQPDFGAPPVTDDDLRSCEREFGVTFPSSLVALFRLQNGGAIRGSDGLCILPIDSSSSPARIRPLSDYAAKGECLDGFGLEAIAEEIGDPTLIFAFAFDGAYCYALNYNHGGPQEEPSILCIDLGGSFMMGEWQQLYPNFQGLIDSVLRSIA